MGVAESYGKWQRLDVRIYANAVVHAARMPLVTRICNNVQQTPAVTRARRFARYGDPAMHTTSGRAKAGRPGDDGGTESGKDARSSDNLSHRFDYYDDDYSIILAFPIRDSAKSR